MEELRAAAAQMEVLRSAAEAAATAEASPEALQRPLASLSPDEVACLLEALGLGREPGGDHAHGQRREDPHAHARRTPATPLVGAG